jgi:hypothetical protein
MARRKEILLNVLSSLNSKKLVAKLRFILIYWKKHYFNISKYFPAYEILKYLFLCFYQTVSYVLLLNRQDRIACILEYFVYLLETQKLCSGVTLF